MKRVCLLLIASSLLATGSAAADPGADFATLLDEAWEWRLAENPLFASKLGDRRYNTVWRDRSFDAIAARHLQSRDFLRRLYAIGRSQLSASDQLNYELFRREFQNEVDAHQFKAYLMPFSHRGGVQNLDSQADFLRFTSLKDYEDWLARLQEIGTVVSQTIDVAEHGRNSGIVSPTILMGRIPDQIAMQLVDAPHTVYLIEPIELGPEPRAFTFGWTSTTKEPTGFAFYLGAEAGRTFWIDATRMEKTGMSEAAPAEDDGTTKEHSVVE